MNKHNQHGSVQLVVISIVVVAILGAVGFLFWNSLNKPKTETQTTSTQKVNAGAAAQPETLALKDWGVQFTVTNELQKAGIKVQKETGPAINTDGTEGSYVNYYVSTQRQRDFGQLTEENADRLCDAGSGVTVTRSPVAMSDNGNTTASPLLTDKPINDYNYYWSIPSAGGCDGPDTKAIINALKSLKAVE